ncbi:MAG TPA: GGDEF domain-containing protein [Gemmatimonadales bacterium]|nr:GGDEF domain-containing protein [Gemmatimonadales bacterium]
MIAFLVGVVVGVVAAWFAGRLLRGQGIGVGRPAPSGVGAHLLPDPAFGWLMRSHGALGVWVSEVGAGEEGPRAERHVDGDRLSITQIQAVDRRLERARDIEEHGVERLGVGTLVFRAAAGYAVGILLPHTFNANELGEVERDLEKLLDGARRRPQIVALAQAQTQDAQLESAGSVGLRLAYQLERTLETEIVVAAVEATSPGDERVRIVGVSGRGDRRLLDSVLPPYAELARVALGALPQTLTGDDPLGAVVADRRQRIGTTLLVPIAVGSSPPVGAVAVHLPTGVEPAGSVRAELQEAVTNAAPRLVRAVSTDAALRSAASDPLTGLVNRRGLEQALSRVEVREGALIFADLDRFKHLNDTLGHPAGDAALIHFARILREQVRGGDIPARIGGEEFAIWLPGATLDLGKRIAERVRIKLGTTAWEWQGRHWSLSASFGVAACPETNTELENLPAQADAALYVAKRSGRNRVEAAGAAR